MRVNLKTCSAIASLTAALCISISATLAAEDTALRVQADGRALHISTRDGTSRAGCSAYLTDGFKATVGDIAAGQTAIIDLRAFVSGGSLRFAPGVDRLTRVHIICRGTGDAVFRVD